MKHFTEIGSSYEEAEFIVREKYGMSAKITSRQKITKGGFLWFKERTVYEVSGYIKSDRLSQIHDLSANSGQTYPALGQRGNGQLEGSEASDIQKTKQNIINASGITSDPVTMVKILDHLNKINKDLNEKKGVQQPEHPSIDRIQELLDENEFTHQFKKYIHEKIRRIPLADLDDINFVQKRVLSWISECILIQRDIPTASPRIIVLVGPTGVGKTTTIAKLAGRLSTGRWDGKQHSVRIITSDNYRVNAFEQIEAYAKIMKVPVEFARGSDELKKHLALFQSSDIIFIDTPGRSPNDFENIARLNSLLKSAKSRLEVYLTISASAQVSNIFHTIQQFEPFNITSTIITKTDEVSSLGPIISALWEKNKDVSYISYGQSVPREIKQANKESFLRSLSGFLRSEENSEYMEQMKFL